MSTFHLEFQRVYPGAAVTEGPSQNTVLADANDFERAQRCCKDQSNMAGLLKQTVFAIRPDYFSDLFFPMLMNGVLLTESVASNALVWIAAIFWDVCTLPIRIITFLPRIVYTYFAEPKVHPLVGYLSEKGIECPRKDAWIKVCCYEQSQPADENVISREGERHWIYLSQREVPSSAYRNSQFYSAQSTDGAPLPFLLEWLDRMYPSQNPE